MNPIINNAFRPLAGFWFLNFKALAGDYATQNEFRPLAGFWFLNCIPHYWNA